MTHGPRARRLLPGLLLAVLNPALTGATAQAASAPEGVVVEKVTPNFEAARAGLRPGDILLKWERGGNPPANPNPAGDSFRSPFDVVETFIDQSPRSRAAITFLVIRDGEPLSISLGQYPWRVETRPQFGDSWLTRYEEGRKLVEQGDLDKGLDAWRSLAADLSAANRHIDAAWVWRKAGMRLSDAKQADPAIAALDRALAEARTSRRSDVEAQLCFSEFEVFRAASRKDDALKAARQSLAIREHMAPDSLAAAYTLNEFAPLLPAGSPEIEAIHRRNLRIRETKAPNSRVVAGTLQALSSVTDAQGDSRTAMELALRALTIHQAQNPRSSDVARALSNIGVFQMNRGELASAEDYCLRSLEVYRALGPAELAGVAQVLHNMGVLARLRGDLDRAEGLFFQSIAITDQISPDGTYNAANYFDLGVTELERDLNKSEAYLDRSEEILKKNGVTDGDRWALRAWMRANVVYQRKDLAAAEKLLRKALAYYDEAAPDHPAAGYMRDDLGRVLTESGQTAEAEELLRRALAQRLKYGSGSQESATSYYNLGMLLWKTGRLSDAEASLRHAIEEYETQRGKVGGSDESMSMLAGRFSDFYKDYARLLLELRREQDAFLILERYRASSFLRTLAQKDLAVPDDVPPALDRERRLTNTEYDRAQAEIQKIVPASQPRELTDALARLGDLRRKQEEIAGKIAKASPRYGALRYPRALGLAEARAALDPGTLLLSYAVGRDETLLFVVSAGAGPGPGLSVLRLSVGEKELRNSVQAFRRLIAWSTSPNELESRARTLYDTLIGPAETLVNASTRLLILPDGPLHTLPWATLIRDAKPGSPRYLAEWKPLHTAASLTVFAELRKQRSGIRGGATVDVAAFGDPKYPSTGSSGTGAKRGGENGEAGEVSSGEPQLDAILRGGYKLEPLPLSRIEVESIAELYAPRSAAYLGSDATEARARSVGSNVPLIHYACHALIDERFPLDSALVFSIPEKPSPNQDNGLLQAWEILEKVRIDADLVTLSACESGLGKEMGGEGLIGLTRAFQFAGARSVLASLWKVEDRATAELMKHFYTYLKAGKSKDEALRLAQVDLLRSSDFSRPRDWAAFQISGDWK
jgi:CHAT domain-containing protein/tetratricopeptide (TPR) repeat protein